MLYTVGNLSSLNIGKFHNFLNSLTKELVSAKIFEVKPNDVFSSRNEKPIANPPTGGNSKLCLTTLWI